MNLVMPTRVLVVGGGGREHALAWKLAGEPGVNEVSVIPGRHALTDPPRLRGVIRGVTPDSIVQFARSRSIELVVIGPEQPLAEGLVDAVTAAGIRVFGPTAAAARLESSKAFCREIASAAGVPMADGRSFPAGDKTNAIAFARRMVGAHGGVVVKADGLAGGKGVTVCESIPESESAIEALGEGAVVVEEQLHGREASVISICDATDAIALPISRDHKRLLDNDKGPNTGGMGAYSPLPDLPDQAAEEIIERFHRPVLAELARRGVPFCGFLYAGLMLTSDGPKLLEFNVRLGDPETQVIMPRLAVALGPLLLAATAGALRRSVSALGLKGNRLPTTNSATVGIVLAAEGYPHNPKPGKRITALDDRGHLPDAPDVLVFHSGPFHESPGVFAATGGRILTVVARGADLPSARALAEAAADRIAWDGMQRRHDIATDLPEPAVPAGAGG